MPVRADTTLPPSALEFLMRAYRFVVDEWPHARREEMLPDQGFEERFREMCVRRLSGWTVSQQREMQLGAGLETASGVGHEVDLVAYHPEVVTILELKNRRACPPEWFNPFPTSSRAPNCSIENSGFN